MLTVNDKYCYRLVTLKYIAVLFLGYYMFNPHYSRNCGWFFFVFVRMANLSKLRAHYKAKHSQNSSRLKCKFRSVH